eukprot:1139076-Pelagomonas_calceolata.AAC.2
MSPRAIGSSVRGGGAFCSWATWRMSPTGKSRVVLSILEPQGDGFKFEEWEGPSVKWQQSSQAQNASP